MKFREFVPKPLTHERKFARFVSGEEQRHTLRIRLRAATFIPEAGPIWRGLTRLRMCLARPSRNSRGADIFKRIYGSAPFVMTKPDVDKEDTGPHPVPFVGGARRAALATSSLRQIDVPADQISSKRICKPISPPAQPGLAHLQTRRQAAVARNRPAVSSSLRKRGSRSASGNPCSSP